MSAAAAAEAGEQGRDPVITASIAHNLGARDLAGGLSIEIPTGIGGATRPFRAIHPSERVRASTCTPSASGWRGAMRAHGVEVCLCGPMFSAT